MVEPARRQRRIAAAAAVLLSAAACTRAPVRRTTSGVPLAGPLIPARTTIVTAWDFPENPGSDSTLDDSKLTREIRWGFAIFTDTPREAARFTPATMSCNNCHLNAGQREKALPLVNVAGMFPEYNRRAGRLFTLSDRIVDCFLRSENATGSMHPSDVGRGTSGAEEETVPSPSSKEVLAVAAYLTWLSRGSEMGRNPSWRGQNAIPAANLVPVEKLDTRKGETLFDERCRSCHGADGQGVTIGDKRPGALWGPGSWNDGAGAARVYTLAGIIRYSMPYLDPGSLTDEEAQELAGFIDAKPRPAYPFKQLDYRVEKLPSDAVYYRKSGSAGP
jgi:thiosulfate dehydrogenase